jgi:hypothetical protein
MSAQVASDIRSPLGAAARSCRAGGVTACRSSRRWPRVTRRSPQIRAVIDEHRARQADARTLSGLAAEISHLRTALEAVAGNVRQHEERLRRIERQATRKSENSKTADK